MSECIHGLERTTCADCNPRPIAGYIRSGQNDSIGLLFDFAVANPDGFTIDEACDSLAWSRPQFGLMVRKLRLILGSDEINLICEPTGTLGPWTYRLVGNYDDARVWVTNRIDDLTSRLETIHSIAASAMKAADGRSVQGRKARKIESTISYLLRELEDIAA
jgi:hypothetical protein